MNKKIITIFGFSVALAIAGYFIYTALATSNPHNWTNGLVGHWSFDGKYTTSTDGTKDVSNNGNYGKFNGGVKPVAGISGQALSFDGVDDYVEISSALSAVSVNSDFTVELWVNSSRLGTPPGELLIANTLAADNRFELFISAGEVMGDLWNGSSVLGKKKGALSTGWHHIVYSFITSGSAGSLYIDGVPQTTIGTDWGYWSGTARFRIGASTGATPGSLFNGLIDEVRIYSRALSGDEVKQHYDQTKRNLEINQSSGTPPVGWWKMDEGTGQAVRDYSVNANNGTVSTGGYGATSTDGKIGKALSFDGTDDYVDVGNAAIFNFTTAFTVEAWVKVNDLSTYHRIVSKFGNPSLAWILTTNTDGKLDFQLRPGPTTRTSSSALIAGNWYHVVAVYAGSTNQDIYVNGVLNNGAIDAAIPASINVDTTNVLIGSAVTASYPMNGLIDDVRIYNYARTADQIAEDFRAGAYRTIIGTSVPSNWWTSGLVGYWNFDGPNTTSTNGTRDTSGNNNWGTFSGGVKPVAGISGQALSFDGVDDYVDLGTANILPTGTNPFTVSFWARPNILANAEYFFYMRLKQNSEFYIGAANNLSGINDTLGFSFRGVAQLIGSTPANTFAGQWVYLTIVYKGGDKGVSSNYAAYINGQTETMTQYVVAGGSTNANIIGNDTSAESFYSGLLDEIRIYNRVLTADEVMQYYQQTRRNISL